eukprot:6849-Rhodomonas_salina.6
MRWPILRQAMMVPGQRRRVWVHDGIDAMSLIPSGELVAYARGMPCPVLRKRMAVLCYAVADIMLRDLQY